MPSRWPSTAFSSRLSPAPCRPGSTARYRLAALIHDAPEYVIGDLISPFKAALSLDYKAFEARLLAAIHIRFGLPAELPADITKLIKRADKIAAYYEATALAGFSVEEGRRYFGQPRGLKPGAGGQTVAVNAAASGRQRERSFSSVSTSLLNEGDAEQPYARMDKHDLPDFAKRHA